ncbi:MAG: potassium transporter TrkG [Gammaproteobacteria bacterium]|nr:potassium transporter TrkG [Gammaproteobacteria bacterium]
MKGLMVLKAIGNMLVFFSLIFFPSMAMALIENDGMFNVFGKSFLITFLTGVILWALFPKNDKEFSRADGFLIVVLVWMSTSFFASLPFLLGHHVTNMADALFETVSGVTTTGATVMHDLTEYPISIQFYHQFLQFIGGIGIVVIASALMPMMRIGGMHLYHTEMPGPAKEQKLMPRLSQTAMMLCKIYILLNIACMIFFKISGLTWFQSMCEAFATVSTGGFSLHANSFGHYSRSAQMVAIIFMILGGINFQLHYIFFKLKERNIYWKNFESKYFLKTMLYCVLFIFISLLVLKHDGHANKAFINSLFTVVSVITTTGFVNTDFASWPGFLPEFVLLLGLIGGCAGSTTGGVKLVRVIVSIKQCLLVLKQLLHPAAVLRMTFGDQIVREDIIRHVMAFMMLFFYTYVVLFLCLLGTGLKFHTAFSALTSSIGNIGASIGEVSSSYVMVHASAKYLLILAMLIGRIEIMTIFVILQPTYWKD